MKKTLLTSFALLLTAVSAAAQTDGMFCYIYDDAAQTATVTYQRNKDGAMEGGTYYGDVVIPAKAPNGYAVTTIGEYAFYRSGGMTSLTIPATVDSIGCQPFYDCSAHLTKITIEDGDQPLRCHVRDAWPMGCYPVFGRDVNVEEIYIGRDYSSFVDRGWVGATYTGSWSIIRDSEYLTSVTLSDRFTEVPFALCYGCEKLRTVNMSPNTRTIGKEAFHNCKSLKGISIPEGVTVIDTLAFNHCDSLRQIPLPGTLKLIHANAFQNCYELEALSIPASVDSIGGGVFASCKALRHITVENGNTPLKLSCGILWWSWHSTFDDLVSLETVKMGRPMNCPATYRNKTLQRFEYTYDAEEVADDQFNGCTNLQTVVFCGAPARIGAHAFSNCESLKDISLPEGVTLLDEEAFYSCKSLERIAMPRSLSVIGFRAFARCNQFERFTIPAQVDSIGASILDECENLKRIDIAYSPTPLKYTCPSQFNNSLRAAPIDTLYMDRYIVGAFSDNRTVKKLYVGPNVTSIINEIFSNCYNIDEVYSLNPVPPVCEGSSVFYSGTKEKGCLHVPDGSVDAYKAAFCWKDFFNIDAASVAGTKKDAASVAESYTLSGQRASNTHRGLTIQRLSDGTTRKTFSDR